MPETADVIIGIANIPQPVAVCIELIGVIIVRAIIVRTIVFRMPGIAVTIQIGIGANIGEVYQAIFQKRCKLQNRPGKSGCVG